MAGIGVDHKRLPKPKSRRYIAFITGDRLRPDWQAELSRNAKLFAAGRASFVHSFLLVGFISSLAFDLPQTIGNRLGIALSWQWIVIVGLIVVYFGLTLLFNRWEGRLVRRYIGKRLKVMGVRPLYCPGCDYNLEGTVSPQCPECGLELAAESDEIRPDPGPFHIEQ